MACKKYISSAKILKIFYPKQWRIQENGGALFCRKWGGAHPVFR